MSFLNSTPSTSSTSSTPSKVTSLSPSPSFSTSTSTSTSSAQASSASWERAHYLSLTLWDIDREFQKSHEAYQQWLAKNQRKKSKWHFLAPTKVEDEIVKTLKLGRQIQTALEEGIEAFGSRFEQGDSTCTSTLAAQLLRVQHEIRVPLEDCALARFSIAIPHDALLTAAKGVRRACLQALRDQHTRLLKKPTSMPFLPPPKFSVDFCTFANQLQRDDSKTKKTFQTSKLRRHDRHDEREICPQCSAHVAVTAHSGMPDYRRILLAAHLSPASSRAITSSDLGSVPKATFACTGCYKTFEDSYGFLDHYFQKEMGSERSCQTRFSMAWHYNPLHPVESDPVLVDKCIRNCLKRELTRAKDLRKSRVLDYSTSTMTKSSGPQSVKSFDASYNSEKPEWGSGINNGMNSTRRRRGETTLTFARLRGSEYI